MYRFINSGSGFAAGNAFSAATYVKQGIIDFLKQRKGGGR
jgi:hypothetical protein